MDGRGPEVVEVKVFGAEPPCAKCKQSEQEARKAAAKFPGQVSVEKLSAHSPQGVAFGFVMTPAVVVNGKVVAQGRVPMEEELERILRAELGG
jgi:protein-disulfide isomerase